MADKFTLLKNGVPVVDSGGATWDNMEWPDGATVEIYDIRGNWARVSPGVYIHAEGGVVDPPPAELTVSIEDSGTIEGNSATKPLSFRVVLSAIPTEPVVVNYQTADGSAKAGEDFENTTGTVTFNAGETGPDGSAPYKLIEVPLKGDLDIEATETFTVSLVSPTGAKLGRATATGTIVTDDIDTTNPPISVHFPKIINRAELQSLFNKVATEKYVEILSPGCKINLDGPTELKQENHDGGLWGVDFSYAQLDYVGPGGQDMITVRGVKGSANRALVFKNVQAYGGGYDRNPCNFCIKVYAPEGDPGSFYKMTMENVFTSYGTYGIGLVGAVFELLAFNVHAENHRADGIFMSHTHTPNEHQGIVSNAMIIHPNSSRNKGAGVLTVNSANIVLGSFVLNGAGGIVGPEGARLIFGNNAENSGESAFKVPTAGWGSNVLYNEASSDGSTHYRAFEGGQWVSYGKPMLYLLDRGGDTNVYQEGNKVSYYGSGTNPMRVIK
jgi:hypothetical protein